MELQTIDCDLLETREFDNRAPRPGDPSIGESEFARELPDVWTRPARSYHQCPVIALCVSLSWGVACTLEPTKDHDGLESESESAADDDVESKATDHDDEGDDDSDASSTEETPSDDGTQGEGTEAGDESTDDDTIPDTPETGDPSDDDLMVVSRIDDLEDLDRHINDCASRTGFWFRHTNVDAFEYLPGVPESFVPSSGSAPDGRFGHAQLRHERESTHPRETVSHLGFYFNREAPGDDGPTVAERYDASAFTGVAFYARADADPASVRLNLFTGATVPENAGGTCVEEDSNDGKCGNAHGVELEISEEWQRFVIRFHDLEQQPGWGQTADFDPSELIELRWTSAADSGVTISVDEIAFVGQGPTEDESCRRYHGETGGTDMGFADMDFVAGVRSSRYGVPGEFPEPDYWVRAAKEIADRWPGSTPVAIWILGEIALESGDAGIDGHCMLYFPPTDEPLERTTYNHRDLNHDALSAFDAHGVKVWLQIEPGLVDTAEVIHETLRRYGRHPSVVGFGVDVEFHQAIVNDGGIPVTDQEVMRWLEIVKSYNEHYTLMLKHYNPEFMPKSVRDEILFINDGQGLDDLDALMSYFDDWLTALPTARSAYQVGYESDRHWWEELGPDPIQSIGDELRTRLDAQGMIWVDFTLTDVIPPTPRHWTTESPRGSTQQ